MSIVCPHCNKEIGEDSINIAALLNARKEKIQKNCVICGKEFVGVKKARFCSNACRCKDYQNKKKAKK